MRVAIIGGSIAGCATAALLRQAGHDVTVFERSESGLVSRGAGIVIATAGLQDMIAHGLIDETLPACQVDCTRLVTRAPGTGQQRWLGDVHVELTLLNWAHLFQQLRRRVPDDLYRDNTAVERLETTPRGATVRLVAGESVDVDLVVCADGYRSLGRGLVDPGAALVYRGMVLWRGLIPERELTVDALDGCDFVRSVYQGGHGVAYYIPGPGQRTERGSRLLMWGYYLQVDQSALAPMLVDDHRRQQSGSVPFGKVHPRVRADLESRLAGLLPSSLFELARQTGNSSIQAIFSAAPASYARDRLALAGDAGAVLPPFAGSGVLRAAASAISLADALAGTPATDDALRQWSEAQLQAAAQFIPNVAAIEQGFVFGLPDLAGMPTAATNDWLAASYPGFVVDLPGL
jgi:2-polyprenyl-6-methoxyphenol hydroxylase-like FAD-dependent oxidoreductase